jgi:NADPH2:quinone reductase
MRAVRVHETGPPSSVRVETVPDLHPGPGEVRIDVHAIGVNYPDVLVVAGTYQNQPPRPFSPGKEAAGIVAAIGDGVTAFRPGERVSVQVEHGAYAEQIVAAQDLVHPIPAAASFDDAAAIGLVGQTAHFALVDRGQLRPGETVLITGAGGGVGLAAVQIAKALGATVLAGVRNEPHARATQQAGADHVVDLAGPNLRGQLREQVFAVTGGKGADLIIDQVGGDVFDAGLRALAWRGRLVVVGFAAGRVPDLRAGYLLVKNIALAGLQWSDYRDREPAWVRRVQGELWQLYETGRLNPRIMRRFPLEQAADALELVKAGKVTGKIVLTTGRA